LQELAKILEYISFKDVADFVAEISWPLVVLLAIFYFGKEIKNSIPRLKKIGPQGAEWADSQSKNAALSEGGGDDFAKKIEQAFEESQKNREKTRLISEFELSVKKEIEDFDPEKKIVYLIEKLAISRIVSIFERIFADIFGSQLEALYKLEIHKEVRKSDAIKYFKEVVVPRFPDAYKSISFDDWIAYLKNQGLLNIEGENISITPAGSDFLLFARINKSGFQRPL
jgi:hypothetical protein